MSNESELPYEIHVENELVATFKYWKDVIQCFNNASRSKNEMFTVVLPMTIRHKDGTVLVSECGAKPDLREEKQCN